MEQNPFFTKRGFAVLVIFGVSCFLFSWGIDSLGLFAPSYDESGDVINGLDTVGLFFAGSIAYFCEGYVAWKLGEEPKEYCKRKYKKEACIVIFSSIGAIILFGFLVHVGMSSRLSGNIACIIPYLYCLFLALRSQM